MEINGDEKILIDIAIFLKNARIAALKLPCHCNEEVDCSKHQLSHAIGEIEGNVKDMIEKTVNVK